MKPKTPKFNDYEDKFSNYNIGKTSRIKKKGKALKILATFICSTMILVGALFVFVYFKLDSIKFSAIGDDPTLIQDGSTDLFKDSNILNVMLFGVDKRPGEKNGRSDSMLLLSVDTLRKKIKLTSIFRDTYVPIAGHGHNKINAAMSFGGESLAIRTIQDTFGIKIDRYVTVNFESFKDIVDILGGLDIKLSAKECRYLNGDLAYYKSKTSLLPVQDGVYHLNGELVVFYSRARHVATPEGLVGDFARTYRQRVVLKLIREKLASCSLTQMLALVDKIGSHLQTNFKKSEIINLGTSAKKFSGYELVEYRIPTPDNEKNSIINGMWVFDIDLKKAKRDLIKFIYE